LQPSIPYNEIETIEKLEEVIDEIRRLMVRSKRQVVRKENMNRRKPT
jgi:hypothetical protein